MSACLAYCSACDCSVLVLWDRVEDGRLAVKELRCPNAFRGCGSGGCPVRESGEAGVWRALEFLPAGGGTGGPRNLSEAADLVERARRISLARQFEQRFSRS